MFDVVIVGAGPAGLQAAVAAGSEGMTVALLEKGEAGGQIGQTPRLENTVFAYGRTDGPTLAASMRQQAARFGVVPVKGHGGIAVDGD
jgi:thioredoxin reductase (NADPH)